MLNCLESEHFNNMPESERLDNVEDGPDTIEDDDDGFAQRDDWEYEWELGEDDD